MGVIIWTFCNWIYASVVWGIVGPQGKDDSDGSYDMLMSMMRMTMTMVALMTTMMMIMMI